MKRFKHKIALLRAIGVVTAVVIIVSGVTFAILQSQQDTLTGNNIQTASANLQLSTDGLHYSDSQPGFSFANLVPGGQAIPANGFSFYLKNSGGVPLAIRMAVSNAPANPNNVDLNRVRVIVLPLTAGAGVQSIPLQDLIDASMSGGVELSGSNLASSDTRQFSLQISMDGGAFNGTSASIQGIDFSFTGVTPGN